MPKELEEKLMREGKGKGFSGDRLNAYVYGSMRNMGWKPKRERMDKTAELSLKIINTLDRYIDRTIEKDAGIVSSIAKLPLKHPVIASTAAALTIGHMWGKRDEHKKLMGDAGDIQYEAPPVTQ